MAVAAAPRPLSAARQRQPRSVPRSFHQCRTMPAWLSVNATKTPTVYSGMRFVTLPLKATISNVESRARTTMPVVNARRSPRKWK